MRVAIYTRISTDEEHQPYSLESQKVKLEAYIKSQDDWHLTRSFTDQASGAKLERPGLRQALAEAKAGRFDLLLVYRVDRFSRSVRGLAQLLEELSGVGVAFRSSTEPFDTTTAAGRMMVQMLGVFAEFERATIIDRVISGMERKAARGEWTAGAKPYGYSVDPKSHQLIVDEAEAPIVPLIFEMYAKKDLGAQAIARWLTAQGHRTRAGRAWGNKSVFTVLRNRAYIGEIYFRGQYHKAAHPPLVTDALFEEVGNLLQSRGDDISKRPAKSQEYLLAGLIICEHCKKRFVGTAAHGRSARYRYYSCFSLNRYGKSTCSADRLSTPDLDDVVLRSLLETFERTNFFAEAIKASADQNVARRDQQQAELATVAAELRKTEDAIERYLLAFENGTLDETTFGNRIKELGTRAGDLRERRADLQAGLENTEIMPPTEEDVQQICNEVATAIRSGNPETKRQLVQQLVHEIRVTNKSDIVPIFRVPQTTSIGEHEAVRTMGRLVGVRGLEPQTSAV